MNGIHEVEGPIPFSSTSRLAGRHPAYYLPLSLHNRNVFHQVMGKRVKEFQSFRKKMNERILSQDNRAIKRFFGVDTLTYEPGKLDVRTKEMLGLVSSMVLRCDDCISYHIQKCKENGVTEEEMFEVFSVALTVGGSIVIPHLRRAVAFLDELNEE